MPGAANSLSLITSWELQEQKQTDLLGDLKSASCLLHLAPGNLSAEGQLESKTVYWILLMPINDHVLLSAVRTHAHKYTHKHTHTHARTNFPSQIEKYSGDKMRSFCK